MELTRETFENWLKGFEPDAVVGLAQTATRCPLANFHRTVRMAEWVGVYKDYLEVDDLWEPLEEWSRTFVHRVDEGREYRAPITAREALRLLEELPCGG